MVIKLLYRIICIESGNSPKIINFFCTFSRKIVYASDKLFAVCFYQFSSFATLFVNVSVVHLYCPRRGSGDIGSTSKHRCHLRAYCATPGDIGVSIRNKGGGRRVFASCDFQRDDRFSSITTISKSAFIYEMHNLAIQPYYSRRYPLFNVAYARTISFSLTTLACCYLFPPLYLYTNIKQYKSRLFLRSNCVRFFT